MIITISGVPGSGKTSVGHILAARLGMRFTSVGELRGQMARERNMTIAELNALGETDPVTDTQVDDYQRKLGATDDKLVMEGRLSWYFIPNSFKILLLCDPQEAATRLFQAQRAHTDKEQSDEPAYPSIEATRLAIETRIASDSTRYKKHYNLENYLAPEHYDLVIDSTGSPGPQTSADRILAEMKNRQLI